MPDQTDTKSPAPAPPPHKETVKETLISIIIAFAMAFVFRSFVIEAFIIPTGSMAPTLLGAHMRFTGEQTGADWAVTPWYSRGSGPDAEPLPVQGTPDNPVVVHDPISGEQLKRTGVITRSGDRILVLKYLYAIREPERFDVVVFKNPTNPTQNYIKRLIGLPGEMIALVDGDVFVHDAVKEPKGGVGDWEMAGWKIARKPEKVQRRVWQTVFDSALTPLSAVQAGAITARGGFVSPWAPSRPELWMQQAGGVLAYRGSDRAVLNWNDQAPFIQRPGGAQPITREITDRYAYDEMPMGLPEFPVSDIRVRAAITPDTATLGAAFILSARGHEFKGEIAGGSAVLSMRPAPGAGESEGWKVVATAPATLPAGELSAVEFWHVDQTLRLIVNGREAARYEYEWTPAERILASTGKSLVELDRAQDGRRGNVLSDTTIYRKPRLSLEFQGGPFTLRSVALDRDLYYQPAWYRGGTYVNEPALGTNPRRTALLEDDQFFVCGDNSPYSQDGRLWGDPEPWVDAMMTQRGMQRHEGVVPRDLMLGKAFFVYFPSLAGGGPLPVPDFGRMRFIR